MKIAISGSTGLIGSALVAYLQAHGHQILRMVRRPASGPGECSWNPVAGHIDDEFYTCEAVINLAGANVGAKRWTKSYKQEILSSRVNGTATIAEALTSHEGPQILINGSAIGYYGDTGDHPTDESGARGSGFLADVVAEWEAAARPAEEAGIRVVYARTGLVVSSRGGAFGRLIPIFKYGLGGRVGNGHQYWSFISLNDEVAALRFCLEHDLSGPVNLVAPTAITNREVTSALAHVLHRPAFLPVPALAVRAALGEFADDILASQNIVPRVLTDAGFTWSDPTLTQALQETDIG